MNRFQYTQEQVSEVIGKSRSHIANTLRLLKLPESVKNLISEGKLSAGHARALIGSPNPDALAREILAGALNVRQAEKKGQTPRAGGKKPAGKDADTKALELLKNSPYKDKLGTAGLFLKALQERAPVLPNLIRPHLGNSVASGKSIRMSALLASAPQLQPQRTDQIAALPLGGRIKLDPWTDQVEMAKAKPVALTSAREKMPFELTPFFPYLTRLSIPGSEKVALTAPAPK